MREDPFCFWCRRPLKTYEPTPLPPLPPDYPTIDHLFSRVHYPIRPRQGSWVLSCPLCNSERGKAEERQLTIGELRWRSRQHRDRRLIRSTDVNWRTQPPHRQSVR
jgi:hypothetical protein